MRNFSLFILVIISAISFSSCLKTRYDSPPNTSGNDPHLPVNSTIAQLVALGTTNINITKDITVAGIVAADDRSGNFYKQIIVEDSTGGITLLLAANSLYNNYPVGRKIYIKCKGLYLGNYHSLPQLGYTPDNTGALTGIPPGLFGNYIVQANYPNEVPEITLSLSELIANGSQYINRLVKITGVEFASGSVGQPYALPSAIASGTSLNVEDCNGNTIIVRTSGYASFQPFTTPSGKGTMEAIYTVYGTTPQLVLRDTTNVVFNGTRCSGSIIPLLLKDFEDNSVTSGGWQIKNVLGSINWATNTIGATSGSVYGQCSNYAGGVNNACETWLISPSVNLSSASSPALSFINGYKYAGDPLQVLVSTNYDGTSDPSTATWTPLSATWSTGNFTWANSGAISLSSYKTTNVHIAFKYTGNSSSGSTWEVDDITIQEN